MEKYLNLCAQEVFNAIFNALREEDRDLNDLFSRFGYEDPTLLAGKGVNALYEKAVQHILFKKLLENRKLKVYTERKYKKKTFENRKCDLFLQFDNLSFWIEVKVVGYCSDGEYIRWIRPDIEKLHKLNSKEKGVHKYLLVTSADDKKPNKREWREWLKEELLRKIRYDPKLFRFFRTQISDGKQFISGYYEVCLLKVP
jgi:hypothetical protein